VRLTIFSGNDQALLDEALAKRLRSAQAAGRPLWLVAESAPGALGYRNALVRSGALLGARVLSFAELAQELLGGSFQAPPISPFQRELLVGVLLESSGQGGAGAYASDLARLIGELEGALVDPLELARACAKPPLVANARVALLSSLHSAYRSLLEEIGREDRDRALAVVIRAASQGGHVLDERLELLLQAPGPRADRAHLRLAQLAGERMVADAEQPTTASARVAIARYPSEQEELSALIGHIEELLRSGLAPGQIAIVHRNPQRVAPALITLLERARLPYSASLARPFGGSAIGAALLGLLRVVAGSGDLEDLLAYLRAPGSGFTREALFELEGAALRAGIRDVERALSLLRGGAGGAEASSALDQECFALGQGDVPAAAGELLMRLFTNAYAPLEGALGRAGESEAAALRAGVSALAGVADLRVALQAAGAGRSALLGEAIAAPGQLAAALARLRFHHRVQHGEARSAIALCDPVSLSAQRPRALLLCGCNDGIFPSTTRSPGLLGEQDRALLGDCGVPLPPSSDPPAGERALFAGCLGAARGQLLISFSESTDQGRPLAPSPLLQEQLGDLRAADAIGDLRAADAIGDRGASGRARAGRPPGAASGAAQGAAKEVLRGYADAFEPPPRISATELECYARCPRRWLIERALKPASIDPEGRERAEGNLAHRLMQQLFEELAEEQGQARLSEALLPRARAIIDRALEREGAVESFGPAPMAREERSTQARLLRLRLREGLFRYLELACEQQRQFTTKALELDFGGQRGLPALELTGELAITGRIDRIDCDRQGAIVIYDYKRSRQPHHAGAQWGRALTLQLALYMRAARELLGAQVVGGLFQPLHGSDLRPRGALRADLELPAVRTDRLAPDALERLEEETFGLAKAAAEQLSAGLIEGRPATCSPSGCAHPELCRCLR
jgi:RecB family exonuclease